MQAFHLWAMATAATVAAACALVGTLLVVRRMSLLGDAIGHAVLPGIAVAVLLGGRPGGPLVFAGAMAAALLTVWLTRVLRSAAGLADDAGAGVAFTALFALGIVIVSTAGARRDLDPSCVLHGVLELVPFDTVAVAGLELPRGLVSAAAALAIVAVALAATWKLQVFTAFDADAARAAGVPVAAVTGGLLAATALVTVAGFDVVGAVLVVALLVVPAAAAELLVRRLHHVALVAVGLAVAGACAGYLAAWRWNASAAGTIAVALGIEYLVAAIVAPGDGIVARGLARCRYALRVAREDVLAALWRAEEAAGAAGGGRAAGSRLATAWLLATGRLERRDGRPSLTPRGRAEAEMVVRSHRLWEAWLGRQSDLPLDHLHPPAEFVEHHLGAAVRRRIEAEVGRGDGDPHGREIPPEA
ncbi:MAG: metal ABC transporter permease [Planctomycetaceae bacterium]